jgi:hypothetical protein
MNGAIMSPSEGISIETVMPSRSATSALLAYGSVGNNPDEEFIDLLMNLTFKAFIFQ